MTAPVTEPIAPKPDPDGGGLHRWPGSGSIFSRVPPLDAGRSRPRLERAEQPVGTVRDPFNPIATILQF